MRTVRGGRSRAAGGGETGRGGEDESLRCGEDEPLGGGEGGSLGGALPLFLYRADLVCLALGRRLPRARTSSATFGSRRCDLRQRASFFSACFFSESGGRMTLRLGGIVGRTRCGVGPGAGEAVFGGKMCVEASADRMLPASMVRLQSGVRQHDMVDVGQDPQQRLHNKNQVSQAHQEHRCVRACIVKGGAPTGRHSARFQCRQDATRSGARRRRKWEERVWWARL